MNELKLKLEIANAIDDVDLKINKLETSLKEFMVAKIIDKRKEIDDAELTRIVKEAVAGRRSDYTVNEWLREGGIRQRGIRSDKGKETAPDPTLEPIRATLKKQLEEGDWSESAEAKIRKALANLS